MADSKDIQTTEKKSLTAQQYINSPQVQDRIKSLLDKRAGQFTTSLIAALNSVPHLAECTPQSVVSAAITAASLDLPINNNLGFAYLIPYKNKQGQYEAQFQTGYKAFIQLAQRSGQYKMISATPVFEGQIKKANPLEGNTYDWEAKKSDTVIGYVAMIRLVNGFEKELYMTVDELKKHGKTYSQTYRKGFGLWEDNFEAMATKTVLKQLISKYGPLSVDMQMAVERDQAIIHDGDVIEYVDNTNELQEAIDKASTQSELKEVIDAMPPEDQVKMAEAAAKRLEELAE